MVSQDEDTVELDVPDNAVGTFADDIEDLVVVAHDEAGYSLVGHGGLGWDGLETGAQRWDIVMILFCN